MGTNLVFLDQKTSLDILNRIQAGIEAATSIFQRFTPGAIAAEYKAHHDPVTRADRAVNEALRDLLVGEGEGWLSEETADDARRLSRERVWIVDPLDGTREFVEGIPEWCVSIALVANGRAVAGGICNPATRETVLGSLATGVTYNGKPAHVSSRKSLDDALVLASRSEVKRGEWQRFQDGTVRVRAMGSVAYKLGLIAAGLADVTWTLVPKHEWDVAAGVALVEAAGGFAATLDGQPVRFNKKNPLLPGLVAAGVRLRDQLLSLLEHPAGTQS